MSEYWENWMKAAAARAIRTVAQTAIATIGTTAVMSEIDVPMVVSASLLAGVLSLLTSLAGLPEIRAERDQEESTEENTKRSLEEKQR